jgi:uncharacterized protein (TIGR02246 family)
MREYSALLLSLAVACSPVPESARKDVNQTTQQDDERDIRAAESRWRKTLETRDTAAIAGFYTDDAVYAPQGSPLYRGRDSVSARWAGEFRIPDFRLERTPVRIEIARTGDLANEVGTYKVSFRDKGQLQRVQGTYMTAWRKADGQWKIASYMWNRSQREEGR